MCAAEKGQEDQMDYFIGKYPEIVKSKCNKGWNALHRSAYYGTLQHTKYLVENQGFKVFEKNKNGKDAVALAQQSPNKNSGKINFLKEASKKQQLRTKIEQMQKQLDKLK